MNRCNHGDGVTVSIGGVPVDPCLYAVTKRFRNATVIISECIYCGHIEVSWERQDDTEEITDEDRAD